MKTEVFCSGCCFSSLLAFSSPSFPLPPFSSSLRSEISISVIEGTGGRKRGRGKGKKLRWMEEEEEVKEGVEKRKVL